MIVVSDGKEYRPALGGPIFRPMGRCVVPTCRRWWSVPHNDHDPRCACGGALQLVNMEAHLSSYEKKE